MNYESAITKLQIDTAIASTDIKQTKTDISDIKTELNKIKWYLITIMSTTIFTLLAIILK